VGGAIDVDRHLRSIISAGVSFSPVLHSTLYLVYILYGLEVLGWTRSIDSVPLLMATTCGASAFLLRPLFAIEASHPAFSTNSAIAIPGCASCHRGLLGCAGSVLSVLSALTGSFPPDHFTPRPILNGSGGVWTARIDRKPSALCSSLGVFFLLFSIFIFVH
jgi:hypothetical protein